MPKRVIATAAVIVISVVALPPSDTGRDITRPIASSVASPATTTTIIHTRTAATVHAAKKKTPKRVQAMRHAKSKIGASYRYGAAGPKHFDCSGLTKWAYGKVGYKLPHNDRMQRNSRLTVPTKRPRYGDLAFFPGHVALFEKFDKRRKGYWVVAARGRGKPLSRVYYHGRGKFEHVRGAG